jgi:predicted alpha/beta hydrolase family esterase
VRALADSWGSRFIDIGPVGHLNPSSGYGEWRGAEALLDVLRGMTSPPSAAVGASSHAG